MLTVMDVMEAMAKQKHGKSPGPDGTLLTGTVISKCLFAGMIVFLVSSEMLMVYGKAAFFTFSSSFLYSCSYR